MTSALHQQIRRTLRRYELCPAGTRVLAGVSGGSDSVALVLLLRDLAEHGGFDVAAIAHFNHRLRPTAARDQQFCADLAARLQLPFIVESSDVRNFAATHRLSTENAARQLRYDFLTRAASQVSAAEVAVGHTLDDQAETFLLKLIRGAGPAGLGGIYPRRGIVVRPLLDTSREVLRRYLRSRGQSWVEDESNDDLDNPRNRIRHRVLPELDVAYGGTTRPAIARAASLARDDGQCLDALGAQRFSELAVPGPAGLELAAAELEREPLSILRRVLLVALKTAAGDREIGLEHVESVLEVLRGECRGADVPGARVELRRGKLVLSIQGQ